VGQIAASSSTKLARLIKRLLVTLFLVSSPASGEQLPTQIDLKAAYCIPIVKSYISLISSIDTPGEQSATPREGQPSDEINQLVRKLQSEEQERLRRLQLYLVPRLRYLDSASILAAMKSGEEDVARSNAISNECQAKCKGSSGSACLMDCVKSQKGELTGRMSACSNTGWLPF